jgi:hypothetical protein
MEEKIVDCLDGALNNFTKYYNPRRTDLLFFINPSTTARVKARLARQRALLV